MFLKSKLVVFILKRVLILCLILAVLDLIFLKEKWFVLAGLAIGASLGIFKFGCLASLLLKITTDKTGKLFSLKIGIITYIALLATAATSMVLSAKHSKWLFGGICTGISLIPLIIIINGITEALGITDNGFE